MNIRRAVGAVCLFVGVISLCAFVTVATLSSHYSNKEDYVISDGVIYSWKTYKCIDGVMYRKGRSFTLLVNANGSPKLCKVKVMTNGEFYKLTESKG